MKKFRGKALAALLSLALVASSFPVTLASASTKSAAGVLTDDPTNDEFWLVNGGSSKSDRSIENFQDYIFEGGNAPLETATHQDVDDPEVYSVSHVSGDKLVSWDVGDKDDDDKDEGDVTLSLRKSDSEGTEVIAVLYRGTYTDDDDNDVYVTASTKLTIHVMDEDSTVIGDASDLTEDDYYNQADGIGCDSPELDGDDSDDDNFALKTTGSEDGETKQIAVFQAERANASTEDGGINSATYGCFAVWKLMPTISEDGAKDASDAVLGAKEGSESDFIKHSGQKDADEKYGDIAYVLECNTAAKNLTMTDGGKTEAKPVVPSGLTPSGSEVTNLGVAVDGETANSDVTITNGTESDYWYAVGDGTAKKVVAKDGETAGTATIKGTDLKDSDVISIFADEAAETATVTYTYSAGTAGVSASDATGIVTVTVNSGASTASLTFKGKVTDAYSSKVSDDNDIKAKAKIEKKVLVNDDSTSYTIYKDDSYKDTVIKGAGGTTFTGDENKGEDTTELDIDGGYTVKFIDKTSAEVNVKDDASIDGITGKVGTLNVNDAKKVGTINLKAGDVKVGDSDVKVDDITSKVNAEIDIDSDNSVGNITVKDDDGTSSVTMSAGSAKSITTKGTVELDGSEDDTPISVGPVKAKSVTLDSNDGAVSVDSIVMNAPSSDENGAEISLKGDQTTVKSIDFAGYGVDLKTEDFQGDIPAPQNATADDAVLETTDADDDITVTGDLDINAVTVEDESKVVFNGKLSVDDLDGAGTMYIGANKLYVGEDATGVLVKVTDNTIKAGDTIFTAASDAVDEDDLDFYGFTVKCNEGKSTDTFVVDQLKFAGLMMNKTSDKIVLNDSATYTASAYAPGTSLPEGYSIEFDIYDNSGVFELTDNGNGTAVVKCVDFDDVFSDENKVTLEAYVVDEDGDEDDDYGMAECNLTALKTPEKTFTSDTNNDFTLASGASYQFKITDATAAPVMTAGTAGVVDIANVGKSGNDYFIKVTAKGAANAKTGIYVNGTKLLVITVGGVVCDTTTDITVKKGASYQYKVTASAAPTFGIGTAGVFNYSLVSHSGNNYFYKITAVGAVGATAGVYVNGQKVNVAKVG